MEDAFRNLYSWGRCVHRFSLLLKQAYWLRVYGMPLPGESSDGPYEETWAKLNGRISRTTYLVEEPKGMLT